MNIEQWKLVATAAIVYGVLYLTGLFVAAVIWHDLVVIEFAIATAGISYLCFMQQVSSRRGSALTWLLVALSVITGAAGGIIFVLSA